MRAHVITVEPSDNRNNGGKVSRGCAGGIQSNRMEDTPAETTETLLAEELHRLTPLTLRPIA